MCTWLKLTSAVALLTTACAARKVPQEDAQLPDAQLEYTWRVSVATQAPDCFQRSVLLVNGSFQPTLVVTQGQTLKVRRAYFDVARHKHVRVS